MGKRTYKVEYTITVDDTEYKYKDGDRFLYSDTGYNYRLPDTRTVTEVVPEFEPGWYRHKNQGARPYWLQRATSHNSLPGDVYYYTHLKTGDHTLTRINTSFWPDEHANWVRLKFVDDEGTDA